MNRTIDVRTEMRKLGTSKPVHAAAGAGAMATAALRELPARIARLRADVPGYMTTVRTWSVKEYDKLAVYGERVMSGKPALNGKSGGAKKS